MAAGNDGLFQWIDAIISGISALGGAVAGLVAGTWRMARVEPRLELKMEARVALMETEMREKLLSHERASVVRTEGLTEQFRESFNGMRRQIDDQRLNTEKDFVRKEDLRDFREELREDIREIKDAIKEIAKRQ